MIDPGKVGGAGGEGAVPALGCVRCAHGGSSGVSFPPSISPDLGAVELCEPSTEQLCSSSCAPPAVPPGVGRRSPFQLVMGLRTKSSRCKPPPTLPPPFILVRGTVRDAGHGVRVGTQTGVAGGGAGGGGASLRRSALSICVGIVRLQRDSSRPIGSTERETLWWRRAADPFRGVWDTKPFGLC